MLPPSCRHLHVPGFGGETVRPYKRPALSEIHRARAANVRRAAADAAPPPPAAAEPPAPAAEAPSPQVPALLAGGADILCCKVAIQLQTVLHKALAFMEHSRLKPFCLCPPTCFWWPSQIAQNGPLFTPHASHACNLWAPVKWWT